MATITIQFVDNQVEKFSSNLDYLTIEFWAGYVTTFNNNVKHITIDYEQNQKIFKNKAIN